MTKKLLVLVIAISLLTSLFTGAMAVEAQSVHLFGAKELISGKSSKIEAVINPQNALSQTLSWSSSDTGIAAVNSNGVVTARDVSERTSVTITARASASVFAEHVVNVNPRAYSVSITPARITLDLSNEGYIQLSAVVYPENASQEIVWSVSNGKIATITEEGLLSAKKKGVVTVRAKVLGQEDVMASARVEITRMASSVTIKGATRLVSGKKTKLACVTIPKINKKNAVIWESLTPEIAKVSTSGKVTALYTDTQKVAVIKATARNNPDVSDTHEITIVPSAQ